MAQGKFERTNRMNARVDAGNQRGKKKSPWGFVIILLAILAVAGILAGGMLYLRSPAQEKGLPTEAPDVSTQTIAPEETLQPTEVLILAEETANSQPAAASPVPEHTLNTQETSYWELSIIPNGDNAEVSETYYVCLGQGVDAPWRVKIVSDTGDDLVTNIYSWSYDQGTDTVKIDLLYNPWDSGEFTYQDGVYFCQGTYRKLILTASADAQEKFGAAESAFLENYSGYNPVQRLLRRTQHDGYLRFPETEPDTNFKFQATFHSFGVIKAEEEAYTQKIRQAIAPCVEVSPDVIHANEVLLGVEYPTEGPGGPTVRGSADVINLVYKNVRDAQDEYTRLWMATGSQLLDGASTGGNATAADWGEACFFWNETQAVTIFRIHGSIVIFRGPVKDIQTMTRFLSLCDYLWN